MSALRAVAQEHTEQQRFLRRTSLLGTESNTNFKMLDNDIGETITSEEADRVTPLMSKIYTRLLLTPSEWKEADRVLRFTGVEGADGNWTTAWVQLCRHLRVSSETASKALKWMHEQGIIGYNAHKNGVGIRIFLNRATRSVANRKEEFGPKKFGPSHTSTQTRRTSLGETPFKDSFAEEEILDKDLNPHAPKTGAKAKPIVGNSSDPAPAPTNNFRNTTPPESREDPSLSSIHGKSDVVVPANEIVRQLQGMLEPTLKTFVIQTAQREHERTRQWLESSGIPKAVRVAQRESYGVLRAYGLVEAKKGKAKYKDEVGRSFHHDEGPNTVGSAEAATKTSPPPQTCARKRLSEAEVLDLAEACVALLKTQGKPIKVTVQQMTVVNDNGGNGSSINTRSDDSGQGRKGWLSAADAERVSALANELMGNESLQPPPRMKTAC